MVEVVNIETTPIPPPPAPAAAPPPPPPPPVPAPVEADSTPIERVVAPKPKPIQKYLEPPVKPSVPVKPYVPQAPDKTLGLSDAMVVGAFVVIFSSPVFKSLLGRLMPSMANGPMESVLLFVLASVLFYLYTYYTN